MSLAKRDRNAYVSSIEFRPKRLGLAREQRADWRPSLQNLDQPAALCAVNIHV